MDSNWRFFGYDIARLRQDVYVNHLRDLSGYTRSPEAPIYPTTYSGYWNLGKPADEQSNEPRLHSDAQTPAPGDERAGSLTIEQIRDQIMGEQPSTTSDRATQWYNVESMLFHLQSELFGQTDSLEAQWESPSAKDAYLRKVGETLAHIEVWREAADANHQGLALLAGAMRRAQTKMEELWQRYTEAMWQATDDYMNMPTAHGPNPNRGFEGETRTLLRQSFLDRYDLPYIKEARERYNQEARELISETADSYASAISKLESARARRMNPMNAILHPRGRRNTVGSATRRKRSPSTGRTAGVQWHAAVAPRGQTARAAGHRRGTAHVRRAATFGRLRSPRSHADFSRRPGGIHTWLGPGSSIAQRHPEPPTASWGR